MPKNNSEITVAYWSTKGLGAPLRQMVLYSGVPLKCIFYKTTAVQTTEGLSVDGSHWHLEAKPALQKINPLINLPFVEVHDEDQKIVVAQSIACMTILLVS
jgi:propanediol utilization protein